MSCRAFPSRRPTEPKPRPAIEHMPFVGHRNCAQWGPNVRREYRPFRNAMEYGLDPAILLERKA